MIVKIFEMLPYKMLRCIGKIIPVRYRDMINSIAIKKYIETGDVLKYSPNGKKICVIRDGEFPFPLFQIFFMESMISLSIYCMYNNYKPVIKFFDENGVNLWEQFLTQPYGDCSNSEIENGFKCDKSKPLLYFPPIPNEKEIKIASRLYRQFVHFNSSTQEYFDNEYDNILNGKNVLGVLCRGTDYTANRPKGHPIQPSVEELIAKVKVEFEVLGCDYIYLATEELKIKKQFDQAFPGKILTNSREYYDAFYELHKKNGDKSRISWVHHNRDNDNYWKSLEYMSSINLLSKCTALIAGNCGGSRAALYLNGGEYKYWYLFDLGMY